MKPISWQAALFAYFTVAPLVSSLFLGSMILSHESRFQQFTSDHVFWFAATSTLTCILAITPPTLLATLWGYFLGWSAMIPLVLINFFAIFGIYIIAKLSKTERLSVFLESNAKAKNLLSKVYGSPLEFVFFTKLSPILPFALTNLVFISAKIALKNIVLGGLFGMVPRTLLAVWVGSEVHQIRNIFEASPNDLFSKIVVLVLVVVSMLGLMRFFLKKK